VEAGLGIDFIHEENDYIDFFQKTDHINVLIVVRYCRGFKWRRKEDIFFGGSKDKKG
jgi:hypothetical protein